MERAPHACREAYTHKSILHTIPFTVHFHPFGIENVWVQKVYEIQFRIYILKEILVILGIKILLNSQADLVTKAYSVICLSSLLEAQMTLF